MSGVSKIILFCFTVLFTIYNVDCNQFRKDYTYEPLAGGYFKLHRIPATFQNAFLKCDAEGAVVASPLDSNFRKAMIVQINAAQLQSCGVYTGIHSMYTKGVYKTIDGKPIEEIDLEWAQDEPDNYKNQEDCLIMTPNGTMADIDCKKTFPFICYKQKTNDMVITNCGTVDKEYVYEPLTGSCYKFHSIGRTWQQAYMRCSAEGGSLAIANSPTEAVVIRRMFADHSSEIFGMVRNAASLGFSAIFERYVWYTVDGKPLQKAGYSNFAVGQPDDNVIAEGGSPCGGVFDTGLLDDFGCYSFTAPFICEKSPYSLV